MRPLPGATIPQFYFPLGSEASTEPDEACVQKLREVFEKFEDGKVAKNALAPVLKVCSLSSVL